MPMAQQKYYFATACAFLLGVLPAATTRADIVTAFRNKETHAKHLELMFGFPPQHRDGSGNRSYHVQILDIKVKDDNVPNYLDRISFYARPIVDGRFHGEPKWIPGTWADVRHFDYDAALDHRYYFSNRHELTRLVPGSPGHRRLLNDTLDPDGAIGLSKGETPPVPEGAFIEGMLTHDMLFGPLNEQQRMELAMRSPYDPVMFSPGSQRDFGHPSYSHPLYKMIDGLAMAIRYPQASDPGFDKETTALFGWLLTLSHIDPQQAPPEAQARATRLRALGDEAAECLSESLGPFEYSLYPEPDSPYAQRGRFTNSDDKTRACIRIILSEPSLLRFQGRSNQGEAYSAPVTEHGEIQILDLSALLVRPEIVLSDTGYRPRQYSELLVRRLIYAAQTTLFRDNDNQPERTYTPPEDIRKGAIQALVYLCTDPPPEPGERPSQDAMEYRALLHPYLRKDDNPTVISAAQEVLSRVGWGERGETRKIVESLLDNMSSYATELFNDFSDGQPDPNGLVPLYKRKLQQRAATLALIVTPPASDQDLPPHMVRRVQRSSQEALRQIDRLRQRQAEIGPNPTIPTIDHVLSYIDQALAAQAPVAP